MIPIQELNININPSTRHDAPQRATTRHQRKKKGSKRGFMDVAVIYCLFMCTVLDTAILGLYWHSATAPDSLAIAAMAAPWMVEFGAMATIKNKKNQKPTDTTTTEEESKGE